jgi:hypothetical protein
VSLGSPSLACPQHAAACVSLLQNHNVKERHTEKHLCTRTSEAEARFLRAETVSGLGGRRGFYSRRFPMSTTFSRKKRIFQQFKKSLIFQ